MRLLLPLFAALLLCAPAVAAEPLVSQDGPGLESGASVEQSPEPAKKSVPWGLGGWAHFGGGGGVLIGARRAHPVGRVDVGFGGYLFLVYGGLAANVSFSGHLDLVVTGVGYAGLVLPIPLVKPLIGFKFGGGLHQDAEWGPSPAIQLGPQIGLHIGQIAGSRFGIRIMVEAEAIVSTEHRAAGFGVLGTVGLML
jgi:hypothetical protein